MLDTLNEYKVCVSCLEANLIEEVKIARCSKCNGIYCLHFASSIDPQYCTSCLAEVSVTREIVQKVYQSYNEETDVVTVYKRRAKSIRLEGMDWLFAQRKINSMSDDALELAIEYHRALLGGLLKEREDRRTAHAHRFAGVAMPKPQSIDVAVSTSTTTKTTKAIKSTKQQATAAGVMASLLAKGLSPQQMLELLQKAQK